MRFQRTVRQHQRIAKSGHDKTFSLVRLRRAVGGNSPRVRREEGTNRRLTRIKPRFLIAKQRAQFCNLQVGVLELRPHCVKRLLRTRNLRFARFNRVHEFFDLQVTFTNRFGEAGNPCLLFGQRPIKRRLLANNPHGSTERRKYVANRAVKLIGIARIK